MSEAIENEYAISELPDLDRESYVYFVISCPDDLSAFEAKLRNAQTGKIRIELASHDDGKLIDMAGQPSTFIVHTKSMSSWYFLFLPNKSSFVSRNGQGYRVKIQYSPDAELHGARGFLFIETGGRK